MNASARPLLEVRGLSVDVGRGTQALRVVNDVSLDVARGDAVGLVGESGSGKSMTAFAIINLFASPDARVAEGEVLLEGRNLARLSQAEMKTVRGGRIGMVFQDPTSYLDPLIPVGRQIAEPLRAHGQTDRLDARVLELIDMMELPHAKQVAAKYPHELSGGMRQRILIASALALRPALLIADEPTTALDVTVQAAILSLLTRLRKELDLGILLITHDLAVVAEACQRICVMYAGQIVETNEVASLFERPRHPYTQGLLASILHPRSRARSLFSIAGGVPVAGHWPQGCRFHPRCPIARHGLCDVLAPALRGSGSRDTSAAAVSGSEAAGGAADRCLLSDEPVAVDAWGHRSADSPSISVGSTAVGDRTAIDDLQLSAPVPKASAPESHPSDARAEVRTGVPLLAARNLSRLFAVRGSGGLFRAKTLQRAVDDVSLQIYPGEVLAVVGESGSGKTTLGRMLLGLTAPSEGSVDYKGVPIARMDRDARRTFRREMQVVFQDTGGSLNPRHSIGHSVGLPLVHNRGLSRRAAAQEVDALLDQVGLPPSHFRDRLPHELSGGQRQRVGIARALASNPSVIVADEPVSALDVSIRAQILRLMDDLRREKQLSYLFITHDLGVVRAMADRVMVMTQGRVVESNTVDALLNAPQHEYTRRLLAATPVPNPSRRRNAASDD